MFTKYLTRFSQNHTLSLSSKYLKRLTVRKTKPRFRYSEGNRGLMLKTINHKGKSYLQISGIVINNNDILKKGFLSKFQQQHYLEYIAIQAFSSYQLAVFLRTRYKLHKRRQ